MNRLSLRLNRLHIRPTRWILFFSLVGFGLRLHRLDFQPLWGDEGWSFYFATQSLPQLLALTAVDIHPPLYYILLKAWLWIIGLGPEEARLLSVIVGTVLIPTLGVLGRRLFNASIGLIAAVVVAGMPLAIYYSQEVRMYGLVTLLSTLAVYFFLRSQSEVERGSSFWPAQKWRLAYVLSMTAALYTMYYAAFILLFQGLYTLLRIVKKADSSPFIGIIPGELKRSSHPMGPALRIYPDWLRRIRANLACFSAVILLYLPWVVYAGPRLVSYVENKRAVEGYLPLNFMNFFGSHMVAFSLGHLSFHLQDYVWTTLPFVLAVAVGFMATLYIDRSRLFYLYLYLFVPLLLGYAINQIFPFTPPFFERTLLLAAPAYWLFIAAGLGRWWSWQPLVVTIVALAMFLIVGVSLTGFYMVPRYPHEDYRPLLADIGARATPEDTVLASYQWQLGFYRAYLPVPYPHLLVVPEWGQAWAGSTGHEQLIQDLTAILERSPRLWFPAYQAQGHFWEDEAEAAIAQLGYPALLQWYSPQTKLTLAGSSHTLLTEAPAANFENRLTLLAARAGAEKYEAGRGIVPIELIWRKEKSLGSDHRVSLRLADSEGRTWAIRDSYPRASQIFFTDLASGETLIDRHGLLIPAGAPPNRYRLLLSVRRVSDAHPMDLLDATGQPLGAELLLTEVEVIDPNPPVGAAALPVQFRTEAVFGQAVRLAGYSLGSGPFKAGESLPLHLFWESLTDSPGSLTISVQLQNSSGQIIASHEYTPLRPTTAWQRGTLLHDPLDWLLPPTLPPGDYRLRVGLLTPEKSWLKSGPNDQLSLTTLTTIDRPRVLEAPNPQISLAFNFGDGAKLVGLDLPQTTVKAGEELSLTLYWQALATFDQSWTVFVHLVDDQGQIVTQQDQIPGAGQFPTTGWLPNEYLVDPYRLLIPADTPPGQTTYHLEIGLYNANDFSRLPVLEAGQTLGDHIILENWPISVK